MIELAPPYPEDTRAKGWRFELDHERIRQSDTWALASPDVRPWLLLLWMVAWEQTPCGSLPAEHDLIAAKIGMPRKTFEKHRAVLLRGWQAATDGRLYHPVLTERVRELLGYKEAAAKRKAEYRAKMAAGPALSPVRPAPSRVRPTGQHGDTTGTNATGTGTGTGTGTLEKKEKPPPPSGVPPLSRKPAKKAPAEFTLTSEMRRWAKESAPGVDVENETAKFRDHTFATSCIDWPGRWRNWLRKAAEFGHRGNGVDVSRVTAPPPKPSGYLAEQAAHRALVEADRLARKARAT